MLARVYTHILRHGGVALAVMLDKLGSSHLILHAQRHKLNLVPIQRLVDESHMPCLGHVVRPNGCYSAMAAVFVMEERLNRDELTANLGVTEW